MVIEWLGRDLGVILSTPQEAWDIPRIVYTQARKHRGRWGRQLLDTSWGNASFSPNSPSSPRLVQNLSAVMAPPSPERAQACCAHLGRG